MSTHPSETRIPIDPVARESFDWTPRAPDMYSRAEVERQTGPYEATITARIQDWRPHVSGEDAADVEDATRQLVAFDEHAQRALGADNPALGSMTAILLAQNRRRARRSSS